MKLIITIIISLLATPVFTVNGRDLSLPDIINLHLMNSNYWEWVTSDALLSHPIIKEFKINQKEDTIFLKFYEGDVGQISVAIWNNSQGLSAEKKDLIDSLVTISRFTIDKNAPVNRFMREWKIDSIRGIYEGRVPLSRYTMQRIIIRNGKITLDTFHVDPIYPPIPREYWVKLSETEYDESRQSKIDSIHQSDLQQKDNTLSPKQSSLSWWERIVDWFRRLWKAIFG